MQNLYYIITTHVHKQNVCILFLNKQPASYLYFMCCFPVNDGKYIFFLPLSFSPSFTGAVSVHFACWTGGQFSPCTKEEIWSITCVAEGERRRTGLLYSRQFSKTCRFMLPSSLFMLSYECLCYNILYLKARVK